MAKDVVDHKYDKPADMRAIDLRPDKPNVQDHPEQKHFWLQRKFGSDKVRIGFPEPEGFIAREHDLEELIEALEELRDFEPE